MTGSVTVTLDQLPKTTQGAYSPCATLPYQHLTENDVKLARKSKTALKYTLAFSSTN